MLKSIHFRFQIIGAALCVYWYFHLPSPGLAVMAMGVAAVIMTMGEMKWQHKILWLVLVFVLAFVESKSIKEDRAQSEERQGSGSGFSFQTQNRPSAGLQ